MYMLLVSFLMFVLTCVVYVSSASSYSPCSSSFSYSHAPLFYVCLFKLCVLSYCVFLSIPLLLVILVSLLLLLVLEISFSL